MKKFAGRWMLEVENRDDYFRNQSHMRAMNPALSMRPNLASTYIDDELLQFHNY